MKLGALLDAQGRDVVQVGGATAYKQRTSRGYNISFEWGPDPDNRKRTDACVVIWPDRGVDRGGWCLFRRGASRFSDPHNRPTPHAFLEAEQALHVMGRDPLRAEVVNLVSVLMDCIDDLVQMPTTPRVAADAIKDEAMWEITRRDLNRKVLNETSV